MNVHKRFSKVLLLILVGLLGGAAPSHGAEFLVNSARDLPDAAPGDGVSDSGDGVSTLRSAIQEANARAGHDTILFQIPPGGPATILAESPLPTIIDPVTIDGTTQAGYEGAPLIELSGIIIEAPTDGLTITSGQSTVRGLVINSFPGSGIVLRTNGGNRIEGNYLGPDHTGQLDQIGNELHGLFIDNAPNNLIGGTGAGMGNVLCGNLVHGIYIAGGKATGNVIQGNLAGTDPSGTISTWNRHSGIAIHDAPRNVIGGTKPGVGNVLSGNRQRGVWVLRSSDTVIEGNLIGVDVTGLRPLGNFLGVLLEDAPDNRIGGTDAEMRNVISGNQGTNVVLLASGSSQNVVQGNFIGLDVTGTRPPTDVSVDPVVSITAPLARGLALWDAPGNLIGGTEPGARNVISGNGEENIQIDGSAARGNIIQGNFIGPDVTGTTRVDNNDWIGIDLLGTTFDTLIGGTAPGAGNVISGNGWGIYAVFAEKVVVQGNLIGTDATGTRALGNGIGVYTATGPMSIGGRIAGAGNVISGNSSHGIHVRGIESTIQGNLIGTDLTGTLPLGNGGRGIYVDLAADSLIGGTQPGSGNVVAHNGGAGILVGQSPPFFGNYGGPRNAILSNSIYGNGSLGIDLIGRDGEEGVTPNDPGDVHESQIGGLAGGNALQNFPVLESATLSGGMLTVHGSLNSLPASGFLVQFFASREPDPTGFGEGEQFLGSHRIRTDAAGNASFKVTLPEQQLVGGVITATATDPDGNTSEFCEGITAIPGP